MPMAFISAYIGSFPTRYGIVMRTTCVNARCVARARSDVAIAGSPRRWPTVRPPTRTSATMLANLHLHLEHEVDLDRVVEIRRTSAAALMSLADAIEQALPALGARAH